MPPNFLRHLYVDINGYFASVEQQMQPRLRHKPVAIVPVNTEATCCIASSYEAKAKGIKTGTPIPEARRLCPDIRFVLARHELYVRVHHDIIKAVERCIHVDEVCSIDEMAARLMANERDHDRATCIARNVKQAIYDDVGQYIRCSVGVGPNKWLAKVATDLQKPDGLVVLRPEDLPTRLYSLDLDDLPGIGRRMHARLAQAGVTTIEQLCQLSESALQTIWASKLIGSVWYHQLRGHHVHETPTHRRTVGHSHVLAPEYRSLDKARRVMTHMIHKAARRLRRLGYHAGRMDLAVRFIDRTRWHHQVRLPAIRDTLTLVRLCSEAWPEQAYADPLKVSVTLSDLTPDAAATASLFPEQQELNHLANAMDRIEQRFGNNAVFPGAMLGAMDSAPLRIAFTQIPDLIDCRDEDRPKLTKRPQKKPAR
ncbi:DNA polymerase Y family protein [Mucisphaera sp.]|uniref:DNA polymerase Y family protein n=1 Tax=Mucisphaera sp. TaxID=2913024 RepID=UPI003D0B210B